MKSYTMKWLHLTKWIYLITVVLGVPCLANAQKQHKRQIYREQVLPALGGKIPDEAFRTDRLALNRLNKDGITVIEGVLLEAREHDKNPDNVRSKPEVIQVYVTQDSRYVPPEGRYHNDRPKSIDTTYVIRKPVGNNRDQTKRIRPNGIATLTAVQSSNDRFVDIRTESSAHPVDNMTGYKNTEVSGTTAKSLRFPPRGLNPPKAHGYANFHRFIPANANGHLAEQDQYHRTIYKPILTPLVIPARQITFTKTNNNYNEHYDRHPSWDLTYDWSSFYQPSRQPLFRDDSDDLFLDSHQIITDYEEFFNAFHGRSYRHVGSSNKRNGGDGILANDSKIQFAEKNNFATRRGSSPTARNEKSDGGTSVSSIKSSPMTHTDLTIVPETNFSCAGKKGTFADVETRCQVFHECSGWSKTSSLCPVGTAYSSIKKRCEWWNTVSCGSE